MTHADDNSGLHAMSITPFKLPSTTDGSTGDGARALSKQKDVRERQHETGNAAMTTFGHEGTLICHMAAPRRTHIDKTSTTNIGTRRDKHLDMSGIYFLCLCTRKKIKP